MRFSVQIKRWF